MNKKRISMTISPDVLSRIDAIVDGVNIRSRSEAIESVMSKHLETNRTAVFLGGGDPKGLLIDGVFKPLLEINGKCLIEHNIERLKKAGFRNVYLAGSSELIGECFKVLGNGSRYGISMNYIEEHSVMGNAKTLQLAEPHLKSAFLVLPVDNFFDFDLSYLSRAHAQGSAAATLAVQSGRGSRTDLGVVEMMGNRIIGYEEKPEKPKTFLTATFIGIYDPSVFEHIPKGTSKWVLQANVFPKLIEEDSLHGCIVPGFYINIDKSADVRSVDDFLRKNK